MTFYEIVRDGTERVGDATRKARFYLNWPRGERRPAWAWTCSRDHSFLFTSREEAERIARTYISAKTGVRVIKFREREFRERACLACS